MAHAIITRFTAQPHHFPTSTSDAEWLLFAEVVLGLYCLAVFFTGERPTPVANWVAFAARTLIHFGKASGNAFRKKYACRHSDQQQINQHLRRISILV